MFQSFSFYRKQAVASIRMASRKARRRTGGGAIKVGFQGVDPLPSISCVAFPGVSETHIQVQSFGLYPMKQQAGSCIDPNGEPKGAAAHRQRN